MRLHPRHIKSRQHASSRKCLKKQQRHLFHQTHDISTPPQSLPTNTVHPDETSTHLLGPISSKNPQHRHHHRKTLRHKHHITTHISSAPYSVFNQFFSPRSHYAQFHINKYDIHHNSACYISNHSHSNHFPLKNPDTPPKAKALNNGQIGFLSVNPSSHLLSIQSHPYSTDKTPSYSENVLNPLLSQSSNYFPIALNTDSCDQINSCLQEQISQQISTLFNDLITRHKSLKAQQVNHFNEYKRHKHSLQPDISHSIDPLEDDPTSTAEIIAQHYSYIYPSQHKPINSTTPIVILSTTSFQYYIQQTFALIQQYKRFLRSPHNEPLPPSVHHHITRSSTLQFTQQISTTRALSVATFMNYPIVSLEALGLTVESLAFSCGFSHEHIPTPYKCLGTVLKHQYRDPEGKTIKEQLKRGKPCPVAGTSGKATTDDLERWYYQVKQHTDEYTRQEEIKFKRLMKEKMMEKNNASSSPPKDEDIDIQYQHMHTINEERVQQQIDDLEMKHFERIIRATVSQQLYNLGVKAVVVVDDIIDVGANNNTATKNDIFYQYLSIYLYKTLNKLSKKLAIFSKSDESMVNIEKFNFESSLDTLQSLFKHFTATTKAQLSENNDGTTSKNSHPSQINPQFTQYFCEWLCGFGLTPYQFNVFIDHFENDLYLTESTENTQDSAEDAIFIPHDIQTEINNFISTTINALKGLHINHIDAVLYNNILSSSKSGGVYSLLMKPHVLTKKQQRKDRHNKRLERARQRDADNLREQHRLLGGSDEIGFADWSDMDSQSDDGSDDEEIIDNSETFQKVPKIKKKTGDEETDDIDEILRYHHEAMSSQPQNAGNVIHDGVVIPPPGDEPSIPPKHHIKHHISYDDLTEIKKLIMNKGNVVFGPLVGVDFINGIARSKRIKGRFDQKSPLIQAVLGSRNAIKATPNVHSPLLSSTQSFIIKQQQNEQRRQQLSMSLAHHKKQVDNIEKQHEARNEDKMGFNNTYDEQYKKYETEFKELFNTNTVNGTVDNNEQENLLPFWEQLDLEQKQNESDIFSFFAGNSNVSEKLPSHAQHLLEHYQTVDSNTPLREIIPLHQLQLKEEQKNIQRTESQLHHLIKQQQIKQQRQTEWFETVQKHVQSGHAIMVDDDISNLVNESMNCYNRGADVDSMNLYYHVHTTTSAFTKTKNTNGDNLHSNNENEDETGQNIEKQDKFQVTSQTITKLSKQQRVYAESSAFIVRHYTHETTSTTSVIPNDKITENENGCQNGTILKKLHKSTTSTTINRLLRICDVTGGFGTDSFILASSINNNKDIEVEIDMIEGDKILFSLLTDGLRRAKQVNQYSHLLQYNNQESLNGVEKNPIKQLIKLFFKDGQLQNKYHNDNIDADNNNYFEFEEDEYTPSKRNIRSHISGFQYENIYSENDADEDNDINVMNVVDEPKRSKRANGHVIEVDEKEIIQSLQRERYFPHARVQLPNIHGLDPKNKSHKDILDTLSSNEKYQESIIKQQRRIVELAEKTLHQYIEGGLGEDKGPQAQPGAQSAPNNHNPSPSLSQAQISNANNPLFRNKILSQQHLQEVSIIAKRLNIKYGNSIEYLLRQHFRIPTSNLLGNLSEEFIPLKITSIQDVFKTIQQKFVQKFDTDIDDFELSLNTRHAPIIPQKKSKSNQLTTIVSSSATNNNITIHNNNQAAPSISISNISLYNHNPHFSPVFSPFYPVPRHTPTTSLEIHRPFDVIYMDPFYPVKNAGKRAKQKMLQRNSKFMSFAKSLQDIYAQQEMGYLNQYKQTKTKLLLHLFKTCNNQQFTKLTDIGLDNTNKDDDEYLSTKPKTTTNKSLLQYCVSPPNQDGGDNNIDDIYTHLMDITNKLSTIQSTNNEAKSFIEQRNRQMNDYYNEFTSQELAELSLHHIPPTPVESLSQFNINTTALLSTTQQYEIYHKLIQIIQRILYSTKKTASTKEKNNDKDVLDQHLETIQSSQKLTYLYSLIYTQAPTLLPLYLNAMLTITSSTKMPQTVDSTHDNKHVQYHPYNSTNNTHSLILTREPENTQLLFDIARITTNRRVVVKRPIYAPLLHKKQTTSIHDNKTRFDVVTPLHSVNYINRVLNNVISRVRYRYQTQYNGFTTILTNNYESTCKVEDSLDNVQPGSHMSFRPHNLYNYHVNDMIEYNHFDNNMNDIDHNILAYDTDKNSNNSRNFKNMAASAAFYHQQQLLMQSVVHPVNMVKSRGKTPYRVMVSFANSNNTSTQTNLQHLYHDVDAEDDESLENIDQEGAEENDEDDNLDSEESQTTQSKSTEQAPPKRSLNLQLGHESENEEQAAGPNNYIMIKNKKIAEKKKQQAIKNDQKRKAKKKRR